MKKKYKVVGVAKVEPKTKFSKGETINFIGNKYFTSPTNKVFFSVKPGVGVIDAIMTNDVLHPYHIVIENKGIPIFKGWVNEEDLEKRPEITTHKNISFANSKKVKICVANNKNDGIEIIAKDWKNEGWTAVFRLKDPQNANQLAHMAELGCAKKNFDGIIAYANTIIEICTDAANIPVNEIINKKTLINSGLFYCFTSDEYLKHSEYLRRGDILLGSNSAIVLSNGSKSNELATTKKPIQIEESKTDIEIKNNFVNEEIKPEIITAQNQPKSKNYDLSGTYLAVTPATLRTDAGIKANILIKLPKGILVQNYGFYTEIDNVKWYYVQTKYKNTIYNGFVSEKCFIKK